MLLPSGFMLGTTSVMTLSRMCLNSGELSLTSRCANIIAACCDAFSVVWMP